MLVNGKYLLPWNNVKIYILKIVEKDKRYARGLQNNGEEKRYEVARAIRIMRRCFNMQLRARSSAPRRFP